MDTSTILIGALAVLAGMAVGSVLLHVYYQYLNTTKKQQAQKEVEKVINRAKSQAAKIERESKVRAKDFESRARKNVENDIRKQKQKLQSSESQLKDKESRLEKDYKKKEETLDSQMQSLKERDERLKIKEARIREMEEQEEDNLHQLKQKLEKVAGLTSDQAKAELKSALVEEAKEAATLAVSKVEQKVRKEAASEARRILSVAISRYASEVATERTVTIIPLTSDEMKGKIIGREGRNIRAMEAACGVDLIIDETPEAVVISSFDAVRREVARQTLVRLMEDGRVNPARIEEVVNKVKEDLSAMMKEDGEKACFDLGLTGVSSNILGVLGSLKYRQTEAQNLYEHSIEVASIAGLLAAEIGANVKVAKRAGLLHDIGRAIDHTVEGSHAHVGADFARQNGEREFICSAIRVHEDSEPADTVLGNIIQAANILAKARPGAQRSMVQNYIRRLSDLESVANSFDGVERTFAIQAGKEVRVLVDSGKVTDGQSQMMVKDIARKIERELNYPGQVKVSVVRETRIVEHAR